MARAEGMVRAIESAEAAYFDAARDVSRIAGARDAAYKVEGLEAPPSALAVGRAGEPKPQARDAGERRSHLAAEIHAKHIEAARKKAVSKSAAASRAKQAAYQSAKSRSIAANVAAKEGRASSR